MTNLREPKFLKLLCVVEKKREGIFSSIPRMIIYHLAKEFKELYKAEYFPKFIFSHRIRIMFSVKPSKLLTLKLETKCIYLLNDNSFEKISPGRIKSVEKVGDLVRVWRNDVISTVREAAQLALEHIDSEEAREAIHITKILADELKLLTAS